MNQSPMRKGLVISIALHGLILFWAIAVFPFSDSLPSPPTPLPVDLVTQAELTKIKAGERKAKDDKPDAARKPEPEKEKKEAVKPKPARVKSVKAPPPAPEKTTESAPEPKQEKASAKAEAAPVPTRKPKKPVVQPEPKVAAKKPAPAPKPASKKKEFDPDNIAALLNKVPDAGPQNRAAPGPQQQTEPARGRAEGNDLAMTFNEIDALRAKISQCWNPPVGGLGADAIQVKLRLRLREEGVLSREPEVVNRAGSPFFQAAADAAVRAVMLCQPYELPARKYALWRDMILNFDPREMFGG